MYFVPWHIPGTGFWQEIPRFEDTIDAVNQLGYSWLLIVFVIGNIVSIAFFNFTGLTVTKYLNATTRMVLDSVRTLFIWIFSLSIRWQEFYFTQAVGFFFLILGTFIYYDILIPPAIRWVYTQVVKKRIDKLHLQNHADEPTEESPFVKRRDDDFK